MGSSAREDPGDGDDGVGGNVAPLSRSAATDLAQLPDKDGDDGDGRREGGERKGEKEEADAEARPREGNGAPAGERCAWTIISRESGDGRGGCEALIGVGVSEIKKG